LYATSGSFGEMEETERNISTGYIIDKGVIPRELDDFHLGGLYVYLVDVEDDYDYPTP